MITWGIDSTGGISPENKKTCISLEKNLPQKEMGIIYRGARDKRLEGAAQSYRYTYFRSKRKKVCINSLKRYIQKPPS